MQLSDNEHDRCKHGKPCARGFPATSAAAAIIPLHESGLKVLTTNKLHTRLRSPENAIALVLTTGSQLFGEDKETKVSLQNILKCYFMI